LRQTCHNTSGRNAVPRMLDKSKQAKNQVRNQPDSSKRETNLFNTETRLAPMVAKKDPDIEVAWYFPNTYEIGMSGLGYQLVWWLFEQHTNVLIRRGFTDLEENNIENCQLLGFTVSWELDFINILKILSEKGIAHCSVDRSEDTPLVFGGGPVLTANPEPFAEFFDIILLGDAEASVPAFVAAFDAVKDIPSITRREKLLRLSQTAGVYVPSLYQVEYEKAGPIISISPLAPDSTTGLQAPNIVAKQVFATPPDYVAHTQILSSATAWSDTFLIEVVRSCPQECRFCLASFLTRPFRATNIDTIIEKIDGAMKHTKRIGLLGPSVTEHPLFHELAERLINREDLQMTVASVRADTLTRDILATIKKLGQRSVTIAIESGSEKLRTVMKKNLSEEEILTAVDLIEASGLSGVKFYGIVGLPYECQNDLDETVRLMAELKKKHRKLKFVFGVSSFVPKAQTPYQWKGRDRDCQRKLEYLRKSLSKLGIEVRPESHNWSDIQTLISRGDRRLTRILFEVAQGDGKIGAWKKAFRNLDGDTPDLDYYAFRDIPVAEILPWSHLVDEAKTAYLLKHDQAAELAASS
jgi:radical SAM superfamily enzyme YgiQ (UPF0313 family)